jgi:electron transport complex protein RnfE
MSEKTTTTPTMGEIFSAGLIKDNPTLRQLLGLCPTLAVTTAVTNGIGMGLATTFVLVCSEIVVSLLRRHIPSTVRIPSFIVIIASFVTLTMMLVGAYLPALDEALGIYLPLIVVNCIVLGRAEAFASKNPPLASAADGLAMGCGFTLALVAMSAVRELLGAGTLLGVQVMPDFFEPLVIMVSPTGGFAVLGCLVAAVAAIEQRKNRDANTVTHSAATLCEACPLNCGLSDPQHLDCAIEDDYIAAQLSKRAAEKRALAASDTKEGDNR